METSEVIRLEVLGEGGRERIIPPQRLSDLVYPVLSPFTWRPVKGFPVPESGMLR